MASSSTHIHHHNEADNDVYQRTAGQEGSPIQLSNGIQISANDTRAYRHVSLANGLSVMLISDPEADKAGAAMDVNVGHFSDPQEVPGLAHFCEHMLFLGSRKYPSENEYHEFLNENGGDSNAFTGMEHTCFYFEVQPKALQGALDRFAQFFVSPLFTPDGTERELNAVDSEHSKNYQSDFWRVFQLDKSSSDERHPYSKFATGDSKTLRDEPQKQGIDVRQALLHFHAKHYVAKNLKLAVVGKNSLDELQQWVEQYCADVPEAQSQTLEHIQEKTEEGKRVPTLPDHPNTVDDALLPYKDGIHTRIWQQIVPNQDLRTLQLGWAVPAVMFQYQVKPDHYISHLMGHEGPGSVLSLLKRKGLATELSAGAFHSQETFAVIGVKVELTVKGLEQVNTIIDIIFSYINVLKQEGSQKWIWKELQQVAENSFRFKAKRGPSSTLIPLAKNLQYFVPRHAVSADHLMWTFDEKPIKQLIDLMTPERVRVQVISKEFEGKTDRNERWYETPYSEERISDELLNEWENPSFTSPDHLHLPKPNDFIPSDFQLKFSSAQKNTPAEEELNVAHSVSDPQIQEALAMLKSSHRFTPKVIRDTSSSFSLWHGDGRFGEPKGGIKVKYNLPATYRSARSVVLTELFCALWKESLNEYAYDASIADLEYDVNMVGEGIQLSVYGFNHKVDVLLKKVLAEAMPETKASGEREFKKDFFDEDQFERIRDTIKRSFLNFDKTLPARIALYEHSYSTSLPRWHMKEKLRAAQSVTVHELRDFVPTLFAEGYVTSLIHGNFYREEAEHIASLLEEPFKTSELSATQMTRIRSLALPSGSKLRVHLPAFNDQEENCAATVSYQLGPDTLYYRAMGDVLSQLMEEPVFNVLRTQQALGYIVQTVKQPQNGQVTLHIIIQSNKVDSLELQKRVLQFVDGFHEHLEGMEEETFNAHISSLVAEELKSDKNLAEEIMRAWRQVDSLRFQFNEPIDTAKFLSSVDKKQLLEFFMENIHASGSKTKRVSVLIRSGNENGNDDESSKGCLRVSEAINKWYAGLPSSEIEGNDDTEVLVQTREEIDLLRLSLPVLPDLGEFHMGNFRNSQ